MQADSIIECVPNFSEGRNIDIINQISQAIEGVPNVKLLNVDPGKSTNRTVITFAGHPDDVIEAAFQAIKRASELIDMRHHTGEHPRMGATDVCPLIPVSGISMAETVVYARKLSERVGRELQIPVYLYESAASAPHRVNLADIRSGEYEGLEDKMKLPKWAPDFGPGTMNIKSGATVIGARDFLIAYNVNLNTNSVKLANEVAFDIRENGRPKRDIETGKILKNELGEVERINGICPSVKAIGWYIEEYGFTQVSMNLTNLDKTNLHEAFEACRKSSEQHGLLVTGSELVGLIPKKAILDAGTYYLKKQGRSLGVSEQELIKIAIQSLGLNSISIFDPKQRIIEYMLDNKTNQLIDLSLHQFAELTSSENPAPGGGSVSAYVGALGAALGTMVANLSAHKKGYESQFDFFSNYAATGQKMSSNLLQLVDADTDAFNGIISAFRLPKTSIEDKKIRKKAIFNATIKAIEVPMRTIEIAASTLDLVKAMVEHGNPNSISDAAVGALCVRAAVEGAALNVKINALGIDDEVLKNEYIEKANLSVQSVQNQVNEILNIVNQKMKLD